MDISVIIPSYNRAHLLPRALASVRNQTIKPYEIIVVDDGSTDETLSMLNAPPTDCEVIYQPNSGVSSARNTGIHRARGEWIAFLDSDDEWLPSKLETQKKLIANNSEFLLCHTDEIWIRNGRRVNPMKKHTKSGGHIFEKCLPLCLISPSSVMIHHSVFDSIGHFDPSLPACEDYDLWLRICARYPVLYLKEKLLIKYGGHEDQLSHKFWGMDRFRVQALSNIISSGVLTSSQKMAAQKIARHKLKILMAGAIKRGNSEVGKWCEKMSLIVG